MEMKTDRTLIILLVCWNLSSFLALSIYWKASKSDWKAEWYLQLIHMIAISIVLLTYVNFPHSSYVRGNGFCIGFVCYIGKAYVFMYVLKLSLNIIIPKYGDKVEKNKRYTFFLPNIFLNICMVNILSKSYLILIQIIQCVHKIDRKLLFLIGKNFVV